MVLADANAHIASAQSYGIGHVHPVPNVNKDDCNGEELRSTLEELHRYASNTYHEYAHLETFYSRLSVSGCKCMLFRITERWWDCDLLPKSAETSCL